MLSRRPIQQMPRELASFNMIRWGETNRPRGTEWIKEHGVKCKGSWRGQRQPAERTMDLIQQR